jgi:hypothetical protein
MAGFNAVGLLVAGVDEGVGDYRPVSLQEGIETSENRGPFSLRNSPAVLG